MDIYADIDVAVSISPIDRFPTEMLEALAAGVPVAAPDNGPTREVLNPPFWLSDTYSNGRLEEWISILIDVGLNRDYYKRMAGECKQYVIDRYCLESFVTSYDRLYRQILSEKGFPGSQDRENGSPKT
jgi:glycosyltransferase involved in cell wall biosynthesis